MRIWTARGFAACVIAAAFAVSLSCSRKSGPKTEQLSALNEAYHSGVFTKEEYDAKKAAIESQALAAEPPPAATTPAPPQPESGPIAAALPQPSQPPAPTATPAIPAPVAPFAPVSPPAALRPVQPAARPGTPASPSAEAEPAPSAGCDDAQYKAHMGGPQTRFFPVPVDRVKKAALDSLALLDFTVHANTGDEIEASKRRHLGVVIGAGGEREILHFQAAQQEGKKGTLVTGETKKSATGILAQKSWTGAVLAEIACNLR